ncbi:MAG: glycosyltransferase family 2 protein [Ilumatobacteraceae bacterium]
MRLSVVVPFYRAVDFIPAAMQNLARQAQPGVEFVLVEDGSGDDTRDELHRWADKVPGARVVDLDVNRGLGGARNAGIDAARGRYLTFLDADDWYGPGYLSDLVDAIELFGCEFVRVDHVQVRDRTRRVIRSPEGRRNEVFAPRESILPSERSSGIDYPYAWAGIFDLQQIPASAFTSIRCTPARTARGCGGCTSTPPPTPSSDSTACSTVARSPAR